MTEATRDAAHAGVLLDLKRYDEAVSLLVHLVAAEPANSRAWCLLATAHLGARHCQEAADAARNAVRLNPSDDWPYRVVSTAQRHLGNIGAVVAAAQEACRLAPHEWRSHVCLAQAQLATGVDFLAAERAAATALRLAPLEPDVHYAAGQVSYAREDWKAARAHLERTLALDPNHGGALNELGRIKLRRGDQPGAARHFIQAAQAAPGTGVFARNVEASIGLVLARMIRFLCVVTAAALFMVNEDNLSRAPLVSWYLAALVLIAGYGAVQLWRMPSAVRPLLRTRRVAQALVRVYGTFLVAAAAAALAPEHEVGWAMLAVVALIFASALVPGSPVRIKGMKRAPRRT